MGENMKAIRQKEPYQKPDLTIYGDIRTITGAINFKSKISDNGTKPNDKTG